MFINSYIFINFVLFSSERRSFPWPLVLYNDDGVDILPASFNSAADAWRYKAPFEEADEVL